MFLRRFTRPLMAKLKESTGIVGLDVVPNAKETLISLYTKTLEEIKAVPEDEGYRKAVEGFTSARLKVCVEEDDWEAIEKRLKCGQVEELIEEAQDELKLMSLMKVMSKSLTTSVHRTGRRKQSPLLEWKPWGVPEDYECEVIENDAPVPKHVPLHRPGPLPEEFYKIMEAIASKEGPTMTVRDPKSEE